MPYTEDEMLMLSGIQHYAFCPRQWALIHIEQQWDENILTAEGRIMHQLVDDPFYRQKMGDVICMRSVNLASKELGLYGVSDIIELHTTSSSNNAITHPKYPGYWIPYPIEYKHGRPKDTDIDIVQLVAQAMCIEEQYNIVIARGAIFYGAIRRREEVVITEELREIVRQYASSMHEVFANMLTPKAVKESHCERCSLVDICMPNTNVPNSASKYIEQNLYEETS